MKLVQTRIVLQADAAVSLSEWNDKVEAALKDLYALFKKKGFVRTDSTKQSALFEVTYKRESKGDALGLDGWHGTGKWGNLKAIFEFHYYPDGNIYKASEDMTVSTNDLDSTSNALRAKKDYSADLKEMERNLAKVKKFVNGL